MKKFNYLNVFIKCDSWLQNKIKEFNGVDDLPFWCSMLSVLLDWGYKREAGQIIDRLLEKQDFFRSVNNTVNRIEMMAKLGGGKTFKCMFWKIQLCYRSSCQRTV